MRGNSFRVRVNVAATTLGGGSAPGTPPRGGPTSPSTGSRPAWPSPWTSTTGPVSTHQVVTSRPEMCRPKDVYTKMEMIIYCDNLICNFFNSVKFQVKEDEEEGLRHNTNQSPRQLSLITQPRAALFMSMLIEIHQSYQNLLQAVLSLVAGNIYTGE